VVYNILTDLPMRYAFESGKTRLFDGLSEAAKLAKPWVPGSATVVLVSDGDTVPASGMPKMPVSVKHVLVVGVGDPRTGSFIAGHQSRQDARTLRQVANRLGGTYHDGNQRQLSTDTINMLTAGGEGAMLDKLTRREYALIALSVGALLMAFLPIALFYLGTSWAPGVSLTEAEREAGSARFGGTGSETHAATAATGQGSTT
jgi:Ca-activated chloride channel family protein